MLLRDYVIDKLPEFLKISGSWLLDPYSLLLTPPST